MDIAASCRVEIPQQPKFLRVIPRLAQRAEGSPSRACNYRETLSRGAQRKLTKKSPFACVI
jgi:hypothetical protein